MLDRLVENLKTAPTRLVDRGSNLRDRARTRIARARGEGSEALWTFQLDALQRMEGALQGAPDLPVVGKVADAAERLVHRGIEATTALPVSDYDAMNTRKVTEAVRSMSRVDLLRVRRYELANKNRKTALTAIERELERLSRGDVA